MMASATIERASVFVFASYPASKEIQHEIELWASGQQKGERRTFDIVHDCVAVLHKVNAPDDTDSCDITHSLLFASNASPPKAQLLAKSTVVVVQLSAAALADDALCQAVAQTALTNGRLQLSHGPGGICIYTNESDLLLLVCGPQHLESITTLVHGPLRVFETLRHKVLGQFDHFQRHFKVHLLSAEEQLRSQLCRLTKVWVERASPHVQHGARSLIGLEASQKVAEACTVALLADAPVRQIQAMLTANLRNMEQILNSEPALNSCTILRGRTTTLHILMDHISANRGLITPLLEAAQCVTQTFHSQSLSEMAADEARESRRQAADSELRERQNFRLVLLGLWLGCNQLAADGLSLKTDSVTPSYGVIALWALPNLAFGWWLVREYLTGGRNSPA